MKCKNEESKGVFQPVSISSIAREDNHSDPQEDVLPCLLCNELFPMCENGKKSPVLAHLLTQHKLVIADVDKIANFTSYMKYWKQKFSDTSDLTEYCVVINTNTAPEDKAPQEKYFLLTDFLPEDFKLRNKLNTQKIMKVLDEQQAERVDLDFSKRCLFCKVMFHQNRASIFKHMAKDHNFNVGNPDNIVHAASFIDLIKSKLDSFTCLFCEKQFKDWNILKDHMRKKGHKRINPENKEYDKYYLINYLEPGKDWKEVQAEPEYENEDLEEETEEDKEKEWEDWTEENKILTLCLFCSKSHSDMNEVLNHMKEIHNFNLQDIKTKLGLSFYHQVKIVNYIRKQVYSQKCPKCLETWNTKKSLESHMLKERHYGLPDDQSLWDQPGYYFPTFDDDNLLCFLEDDEEEVTSTSVKEDENGNLKT